MSKQKKKQLEEEQLQAAYALNLCTVSVSQIVDYDNLYMMEQEYDAILNNLNLEKIIKNDSLLNVLKQILDTITYFKMEDFEKKIIEREYQQQMKNAIWSSVPNFGFIIASRKPLHSIAISLASQIGIGYMNYRKNKNQYAWDKEKKMLKLQQAAMEQLNSLRRELFTTAWNLAEKYEFPDELRLTEKQIKQYNDILKDPNPIRKHERLSFIEGNFKAYPPFWYFYGSTANYIANAKDLKDTNKFSYELSDETRQTFRKKAIEAFEKYDNLDKFNVLREDQITSSFALEYADVLIADKSSDKTKIKSLIDRAAKMSPNAYDVLELCAIAYLRTNDRTSAVPLLRFLVNEDYNKVVNGQLLSSIYVNERNVEDYEVLKTRVGSQYLFPMPKEGQLLEDANKDFIKQQKEVLKKKYCQVIDEIVKKYSIQWNKIYSTFDCDMKYEDVLDMFGTRKNYLNYLRNLDIELKLLNILNDSYEELFSLPSLSGKSEVENDVKSMVEQKVRDKENSLKELRNKVSGDSFGLEEYKKLQDLSIKYFYGQGIGKLKKECENYVDGIDCENIAEEEGKLRLICNEKKISYPEITLSENSEDKNEDKRDFLSRPFSLNLFGDAAVDQQKEKEYKEGILDKAEQFIRRQEER